MGSFLFHSRKWEIAVPAILLAAYLGVWLAPTLREIAVVRQRIFELQRESAGVSAIHERIRQVVAKLESVDAFVKPRRSEPGPEAAIAAFLREATLTGESEGVNFSRVAPRSMQQIGWMTVSEIEFHFSGKTENIVRFLRNLDHHRKLAVIKTLRLSRDPGSNLISCRVELLACSVNSDYFD